MDLPQSLNHSRHFKQDSKITKSANLTFNKDIRISLQRALRWRPQSQRAKANGGREVGADYPTVRRMCRRYQVSIHVFFLTNQDFISSWHVTFGFSWHCLRNVGFAFNCNESFVIYQFQDYERRPGRAVRCHRIGWHHPRGQQHPHSLRWRLVCLGKTAKKEMNFQSWTNTEREM